MKASIKCIAIATGTLSIFTTTTKAQFLKDLSIGANAGVYIYQGDLAPSALGSLETPRPGFSLFVQKPFSNYLSFRLNLSIASLEGDDSKYSTPVYRQFRNFKFSTPVNELSGLVVWNVRGSNYSNYGITPCLFAGVGFSAINSKPDISQMNTNYFKEDTVFLENIARDMAHGTPKVMPVIPLGAGIEFPVSNNFFLHIETMYRFTFTDYLDGFSLSANPNLKDSYHSTSIGVRYKFSGESNGRGKAKEIGCPVNL